MTKVYKKNVDIICVRNLKREARDFLIGSNNNGVHKEVNLHIQGGN